ncbi:UreE urease accessory domain protein [Magnetococcus marinus MC-1]|uniref:Urease accessory protein UreE n=1 Tax=Magnetococcus marinus (strain ATCC BAA-1437 / JCM 17883 / MC-1) TaxID=156889 RepID=A0L6F3_MAGMM|nr:urease accessory protein UreE [Magnetococcus marinus]ABK43546.1 UreE urease accessory domain protein [Magnetococcus marinus MC-1]
MRRAIAVQGAGSWAQAERVGSITLPYDQRFRRRIQWQDDAGSPFLLDLSRPVLLGHDDGLLLDEGGIIQVIAAQEPVLEIIPRDAQNAARLAWHVGNRHTPAQILVGGVMRIHEDHVLMAMLQGLGATVHRVMAPFAPEGGAYGGGSAQHGHDHGGQSHEHAHPQAQDPRTAGHAQAGTQASDHSTHGHSHDHDPGGAVHEH